MSESLWRLMGGGLNVLFEVVDVGLRLYGWRDSRWAGGNWVGVFLPFIVTKLQGCMHFLTLFEAVTLSLVTFLGF